MTIDLSGTMPRFKRPELLRHPQIPKPLHEVNPRNILGEDWWNQQREIAYAGNNQCCWACGDSRAHAKGGTWLEAHEAYTIDQQKGRARLDEIVALCNYCHSFIHIGRMDAMVAAGEMSQLEFAMRTEHGIMILRNAGLRPLDATRQILDPTFIPAPLEHSAPWGAWRLVIGTKQYPPKYATYEEWLRAYKAAEQRRGR